MSARFLFLSFMLFSQTIFALHLDGLAREESWQGDSFSIVTFVDHELSLDFIVMIAAADADIVCLQQQISDDFFEAIYDELKYDYAHFYLFADGLFVASKYGLEEFDYTFSGFDFVMKDGKISLGLDPDHFGMHIQIRQSDDFLPDADYETFEDMFQSLQTHHLDYILCEDEGHFELDLSVEADNKGNASFGAEITYEREIGEGSFSISGGVEVDQYSHGDTDVKATANARIRL